MKTLSATLLLLLASSPLLACDAGYELENVNAECGPCTSGDLVGDSIFTPVNRQQGLRSDWQPDDLDLLDSPYSELADRKMRLPAAQAFRQMSDAGQAAVGQRLLAASTFRSFSTQCVLFDNYANTNGCDGANTFSARAGHSEHQLGTVADMMANGIWLNGGAAIDTWLSDHAHLYGFAMSYPEGTTGLTGYIHEPWHFRWLGVAAATELFEQARSEGRNISTHEFINSLSEARKAELDPTGSVLTPDEEHRGAPRVEYDRSYVLLNGATTSEGDALASIDRFWPNQYTIGFSADDAGIGDLASRHVIVIDPASYANPLTSFFATFYPGIQYSPVASVSAPMPTDSLAIGVAPESGRGQPRVQYSRSFVLVHPSLGAEWAKAVMSLGYRSGQRFTVGTSPDDAGIGDLDSRHVIVINPSLWTDANGKTIESFFSAEYPGVTTQSVIAASAAQMQLPQ